MTDPITDEDAIRSVLKDVESGDELTIELTSGQRMNREVEFVENGGSIQFGDPLGANRVIKPSRLTAHTLTNDPSSPLSSGFEITKLWDWRDD